MNAKPADVSLMSRGVVVAARADSTPKVNPGTDAGCRPHSTGNGQRNNENIDLNHRLDKSFIGLQS
jgi:hypothetical protein